MLSLCVHGHFLLHSLQDPVFRSHESSGNERAFAAVCAARLSFYRHFLMYAGRPIQPGGCRNATTFPEEFEFVSHLQIVRKCGTEIACASI